MDKNTSARLRTKNAGGVGLCTRGGGWGHICGTLRYIHDTRYVFNHIQLMMMVKTCKQKASAKQLYRGNLAVCGIWEII